MPQFIAVKVNAKNDYSGNPRRGWKIHNANGTYLTFVDEGYLGVQAIYSVGFLRDDVTFIMSEFTITPTEYKALKKNEALHVVNGRVTF